jgi:Flp pilus assembly protein TadG
MTRFPTVLRRRQLAAPQHHGVLVHPTWSRRDRGALSLELAVLFPVILMLTFGAVQTGLWFAARNMCQAATEAGVRAGKVLNAPTGSGATAARGYLTDIAGGLVVGSQVTESRTATDVTVQCSGQAQNVIPLPGFSIDLVQSSTAGRERFTR